MNLSFLVIKMVIPVVILVFFISTWYVSCDLPRALQFGLQDPATPVAEGMVYFHNFLMFFLVFIGIFVFYLLIYCITHFTTKKNPVPVKFSHDSNLEIVWTIAPALILLMIAEPSFTLLYSLDELIDSELTVKIIGHQWYWSYEYSDWLLPNNLGKKLCYDSYIRTNDTVYCARLLETDTFVKLPVATHIRLLVTSSDVIHSWAIPSFGIKIDACPGRLSEVTLFVKRQGMFFGQCSEICGVNHGFMPIVVVVGDGDELLSTLLFTVGETA